ncbi:MAG: RsmD family RNA methyltransferase [Fervidobacterium sp.]|jgi:16S rRNA (guanine(966)-N(2))-methyltransferase RsmD
MLKIESGELKGKLIKTVPDPKTRYTSAILRRSLTNMVDFSGKVCADICCGSGSVGFEMLSNGAKSVTFVDASNKAITTVKLNAKELKVENRVFFYREDVRRFLERFEGTFDIVYSDPPYELGLVNEIVQRIHIVMHSGSLFILQCSKREIPNENDLKNIKIVKIKAYGDSFLIFFERI